MGCECELVILIHVKQKDTGFSHLVTDGGDLVPVCRALSEEVSRAGQDPAAGATLPGRGGCGNSCSLLFIIHKRLDIYDDLLSRYFYLCTAVHLSLWF